LAKPEKKLAEGLLTAIRSLPKRERELVLLGLVKDRMLRRDLMDLATIEERRNEPSRQSDPPITKHGKPVAKLIPFTPKRRS
jgi:hypothetical protein